MDRANQGNDDEILTYYVSIKHRKSIATGNLEGQSQGLGGWRDVKGSLLKVMMIILYNIRSKKLNRAQRCVYKKKKLKKVL